MKKEDNRNIYIVGHVGNIGTIKITEKLELPLSNRFINKYNKIIKDEINKIKKYVKLDNKYFNTNHIIEINKGGVFSSLWILAKSENVGMDFSQKDIPIYQITFEICNILDINPYRLLTTNAYLIFETNEWYEDFIKKSDLSITCIGKIYNKKECARIDGDTKAYLTKDFKDEIDKVL